VWIVERMRYPTDQPTNKQTDTANYRGALSYQKKSNMTNYRVYQGVSGYIRVYQGISGYIRVYQCVSECIRVYQGVPGCTRVYQGESNCTRVYQGESNCTRMYIFFIFNIQADVRDPHQQPLLRGEFRELSEDRHSHLYQNPWVPHPASEEYGHDRLGREFIYLPTDRHVISSTHRCGCLDNKQTETNDQTRSQKNILRHFTNK